MAILHDITELKRLEKMRTDFVANVSTNSVPLTAVKGFVEALLDGAWEDKEAARRFLGIVSVEQNRMVSLVKDLLELSRLEGTERAGTQVPVDIVELVEEIGESYESRAAEAELQFPRDRWACLLFLGDATLLRARPSPTFWTMPSNTPTGGRVWLTLTTQRRACPWQSGIPALGFLQSTSAAF